MQFALTKSTWDLGLDKSGNIATLSDKPFGPLLAQRIKQRLQTFQGECFLDRSVGVPYFGEVMKKKPDFGRIRSLLVSIVKGVEGVVKILSLEILMNDRTRELSVAFRVLGTEETIVEGEV